MFDDVFPLFKLKTNQRIKYKEKENNFCKKKITFYLVNESNRGHVCFEHVVRGVSTKTLFIEELEATVLPLTYNYVVIKFCSSEMNEDL